VTGHGAGVGGVPGPLAANQAFSGAAVPAPPQDRLMRAPLIERECIPDTFCFLFVNNFHFYGQRRGARLWDLDGSFLLRLG
jgi:hypothetical protein